MYEKKLEYHSVNTYDIYKLFNYTDATYESDGLVIGKSLAPQSDLISDTEASMSYNYNFLKHYFYSIYNSPQFYSYKTKYYNLKPYILNEEARFVLIPLRKFGKRILQNSFNIIDDSGDTQITIIDDGNGNLIDSGIVTSSFVSDASLFFWISFDDSFVKKQFPDKKIFTLRDNSNYLHTVTVINGNFSKGVDGYGYQYDLDGTSFAYINKADYIDFNKSDFTLSFWIKVPEDQPEFDVNNNLGYNTIISKRNANLGKYPFEIKISNTNADVENRTLYISRRAYKDNNPLNEVSILSSAKLTENVYNHVCLIKSGSLLQLYINGVIDTQVADYTGYFDTNNSSNIFIGGSGDSVNTVLPDSYLSGSIDELRLYNSAVSATNLYNNVRNTNIVGNIFYETGVAVFNNLSGSYATLLDGSGINGFSISYRSVSEITEHEISLKKGVNEFNMTMNPTLRINNSNTLINQVTSSFNSSFTPYITGIGLYNDANELLATAKIKQPIKCIKDIDIFFKIKFDM